MEVERKLHTHTSRNVKRTNSCRKKAAHIGRKTIHTRAYITRSFASWLVAASGRTTPVGNGSSGASSGAKEFLGKSVWIREREIDTEREAQRRSGCVGRSACFVQKNPPGWQIVDKLSNERSNFRTSTERETAFVEWKKLKATREKMNKKSMLGKHLAPITG